MPTQNKALQAIKKKNMKNTITKTRKSARSENRWQRTAIMMLLLILLFVGGCKTPYYTPIESHTSTSVKDSVALVIKDSVRITERSRWKDYGGLLDTLKIAGQRSRLTAWNDTTNMLINATLEEDPVEERNTTIWKDKEVLKDTTIYVEVPVPAPAEIKEIKVVPTFWRVMGILGVIETMLLAFYCYLRLKKKGFGINGISSLISKLKR